MRMVGCANVKYLQWRRWNARWTIDWIAYAFGFGSFRALLHRLLLMAIGVTG